MATVDDSYRIFKGLKPRMFAHELDNFMSGQFSEVPFVEPLLRRLLETVESAITVENLSTSILVGPNQMNNLYKLLNRACSILDMEVPDLFIRHEPFPNAYTFALKGNRPFIVIHTGLLDLMNEKEILSVIGHELGHLKCEHGLWNTAFNTFIQLCDRLLGNQLFFRNWLLYWQRAAEFSCDRASMLVTQDNRVVSSSLMKLCGGSPRNPYTKDLDLDSFLNQAKLLEEVKKSIGGGLFSFMIGQFATHPIPIDRAFELSKWSSSKQYFDLLKFGSVATINP
jgi:Zn-dependent protease with chaperone function